MGLGGFAAGFIGLHLSEGFMDYATVVVMTPLCADPFDECPQRFRHADRFLN